MTGGVLMPMLVLPLRDAQFVLFDLGCPDQHVLASQHAAKLDASGSTGQSRQHSTARVFGLFLSDMTSLDNREHKLA